ncbi:AAA-like domain-containing protein, partial [Nostoc sp. UIC 10890]
MNNHYTFSRSLSHKNSTYVVRKADKDLYEALLQGKFCYVLNPIRTGKSSLCVRTMKSLSTNNVRCVLIDLAGIGSSDVTEKIWYTCLIEKLIRGFNLDIDFKDWLNKNSFDLGSKQFGRFLEMILLRQISENMVIFLDDIEVVLNLDFKADVFLNFILTCYKKRVDNPHYNRLTFCLLGTASPNTLIKDTIFTPFSIGQAIHLEGFQLDEMEPFRIGLKDTYGNDSHAVMQNIWDWTRGQPFLTQKLCNLAVEKFDIDNPLSIDQIVRMFIIENWEWNDEPQHLRNIQNKIMSYGEKVTTDLLELYQKILLAKDNGISVDDIQGKSELELSGLVTRRENKIMVSNRIYQEIFDIGWIENQLHKVCPYTANLRAWLASEKKDDSQLLRGSSLNEALKWAKMEKLLNNIQDSEFLSKSEE